MNEKVERQEASDHDLGQILNLEREIAALEQSILAAKEELEGQQAALLAAKQEEAEAKSLTKSMMEEAEKTEAALQEKKSGLEKQCADLSERSRQMEKTLDIRSKELQDKNTELEEVKRRLNFIRRGRRSRLLVTGMLVILVIVFGCVFLGAKISQLNGDISEWKNLCQSAVEEKAEALARLYNLEQYASPAMVKVNSIYNADIENHKISDALNASEIQYLNLDFDVWFSEGSPGEKSIYVDIYKPDGSLMYSMNSPDGHTTSFSVDESGHVANGWGSSKGGSYTAGTYRIDFVYEDVIVHSQKVEISGSN